MKHIEYYNNIYLDGFCLLDIISVTIEGAVGGSEDVAACYDGASAVGGHLSRRHQAHLQSIYYH